MCCYINGHHKQYIQVDIIFNYIHVSFWTSRKMSLEKIRKIHLSGTGSAGARKVLFEDLTKDMFLEVPNETCN